MGSGQWAVGSGQWAVGSGQWAVGSGQWAVGSGQWAVGSGQWAVGSGQWAVGSGQWQVASGKWQVASGKWQVASGKWQVASGKWQVASGKWQVASGKQEKNLMSRILNPIKPGDILLKEFMEPLGINKKQLASNLDVPVTRINSIIKGTQRISVDTALRLGRHFKTGPELWLNLQQHYDLNMAKMTMEPAINQKVIPLAGLSPNPSH